MGNIIHKDTKRQRDIDIAKGIGIILVVWSHAKGPWSSYINQFHMPFFFFVSGMLYKAGSTSYGEYFKRKFKSLILPFWWWNLLLYPLFYILYYWKEWTIGTAVKELGEILFTLNKVPFLGATWFLPALFWISIFVHFLIKFLDDYRYKDIVLLIGSGFISLLGFYVTFPYKISRILICLSFYVGGYLYNKYIRYHLRECIKNIIALVGGVVYIFIASNNIVSMQGNVYSNRPLFVIGAFLATGFALRFSKWLADNKLLSILADHLVYLGKNTMSIVIWHFLTFRFTIIIQILVLGVGLKAIVAYPVYDASGIWWIFYLVTGVYGSLVWNFILEHNPLSSYMKRLHMI